MDHPFEVGKAYRNRKGSYEVLAIDAPEMRVRYADGRVAVVSISLQELAWSIWKEMPAPLPKAEPKSAAPKGKKRAAPKKTRPSKQEALIAEILQDDTPIYEILTRLTIPPGQIDLFRLLLTHPDDYFSMQDIADEVRDGDAASEQGVFMAFGRRIGASPDERVRSLKPANRLFLETKKEGGKTLMRIRPRVREIFQSYPAFYDFLVNKTDSWLKEEFGSETWEHSPEVHQKQMAYFGFEHTQ